MWDLRCKPSYNTLPIIYYLQIFCWCFFSVPCSCHSGSSLVFFGHSLQAPSLFPPPLSHTGSLLLAVHFYSSLRAAPVIPSTALGILLLILSSLLAYAGKTRKAASFWASPSIALHVFGLLCQRVCTNCGSLARPLTSPAWGIYQHTTFFLYKQPKQ